MMSRIRERLPDAAVSSDFIVGFSGETDADFQATVAAVEEFRFKNSFIFKYSVRPGTRGAELYADDVPEDVKRERNNELLQVQNRISEEDNAQLVGRTFDVLVEGPSIKAAKREDDGPITQMMGRTHCDRIVVYDGNRRQAGHTIPVTIYDALAHTLLGTVVTDECGPQSTPLLTLA
jgi:tRNA-2-methylthio-N6-dimethylallyladenosine synthase